MRMNTHWIWAMTAVLCLSGWAAAQDTAAPAESETPTLAPAPPQGDQPAPAAEKPAAEGEQAVEGEGGEVADQEDKKPDYTIFIVMIGVIVLMYVWMGRSRRKQEKKRKEMLANLKKGDKATSIGGIVGTVMEVREDEVVMKVDETNNIRMKFARWAIRGVGEEAKQEKPEDQNK